MYHYAARELIESITSHIEGRSKLPWFWFRDMCLDAEQRGLVSINHSDNPFWWDKTQLVITERSREIINSGKH